MNTKKLIGMIIGVTMFAALIAGATFAYLTFTANVNNGNYTGITTKNFTFTYNNGTTISDLLSLSKTPALNSITAGKGYIPLTVSKTATSVPSNNFTIYLKRSTWQVGLTGAIRYAVCRATAVSACGSSVPTGTNSNWVAVGTITNAEDSDTDKGFALYTDTTTFNVTTAASTSYYIYFWLDASIINDSNISQVNGKKVSGYVYAEAIQTH